MSHYYKTFKVYLFAGKDVGKKSLTNISEKLFDDETGLTLGVEWFYKDVVIDGNKRIKLEIWVNIDDKRYDFLWNSYIRGSNGIILMYDITNSKSLDFVSNFIQIIRNQIKYHIPILLVGNKSDLKESREVSEEQVRKFKIENNISKSMEISIKTGENVEKMLMRMTRMTLKGTKHVEKISSTS